MQNFIVAVIVGLAVWYIARTFFGKKKTAGACGCACASCEASAACTGLSPGFQISATPPQTFRPDDRSIS